MEELEYKEKGIVYPTCDWDYCKALINEAFDLCGANFYDPYFLETIWKVSTELLTELEVSVIVDNERNLFISKGSGVFVDYKNEQVAGM